MSGEVLTEEEKQVLVVGGCCIANVVFVWARGRLIPVTTSVATELGITNKALLANIAKQEKDAQALISSGKLSDAHWLEKNIDFTGENLGDIPQRILGDIQDSLKNPSAQKRIARMLANPERTGVFRYDIRPLYDGAGGHGSLGGITLADFADWSRDYANPHEQTHGGQLKVPDLTAREAVTLSLMNEAQARVVEFCDGVVEGRNSRGRSFEYGTETTTLSDILKDIDPELPWDDFVALKGSNPEKFNAYMRKMKGILFQQVMDNLSQDDLYVNQFLDRALNASSTSPGNLEGLKLVCEKMAKEMEVDFKDIWSTVTGYATGKQELPRIGRVFDQKGRVTKWGEELFNVTLYSSLKSSLRDTFSDQGKNELQRRLLWLRNNDMKHGYVLSYLCKEKGREWVEANYDLINKILDARFSGRVMSPLVLEKVIDIDGEKMRQYKRGKEINVYDAQNRLRYIHLPDGTRIEAKYDSDGKTRVFERFSSGRVVEQPEYALEPARAGFLSAEINKLCDKIEPEGKKPYVSPVQNPKVEVPINKKALVAGVVSSAAGFAGRAGAMYAATWAGQQFQDWQEAAKENGVGPLMGLSENTPAALQKANAMLTTGGFVVAGTGIALAVAQKTGAKALQKGAGKVVAKSIPVVGTVLGLGWATYRAFNGDWTGAGMELASAGMDIVTAVGVLTGPFEAGLMATSLAIDTAIAARDGLMKEGTCSFAMTDPNGQPVTVKDDNGNDAPVLGAVINYRHDKREGDAVFYGYDPQNARSYPSVVGAYHNDQKEGEWVVYSSDGKPLEIMHYQKGKMVGEYYRTDMNGNLIARGNTDGQCVEYWTDENGLSTGKVKCVGALKNGERVGEWFSFDQQGEPSVTDYGSGIPQNKVNLRMKHETGREKPKQTANPDPRKKPKTGKTQIGNGRGLDDKLQARQQQQEQKKEQAPQFKNGRGIDDKLGAVVERTQARTRAAVQDYHKK